MNFKNKLDILKAKTCMVYLNWVTCTFLYHISKQTVKHWQWHLYLLHEESMLTKNFKFVTNIWYFFIFINTALELVPDDPKALYRRCQAYEKLNKAEEAYKDAAALVKADPKNSAVQPILKRLNPVIQEKVFDYGCHGNIKSVSIL